MKQLLLISALLYSTAFVELPVIVFQDLAPMPTARGGITSVTDNKSIYVCNGISLTQKCSGIIEKFDIVKNEWSVLTESSIQKNYASSAIVDGNLYLFNGDL